MHEAARPKILDKNVIPKLIEVLRDSNIEDIDLSKVAAKALHNLTGDNNYWTIDLIKKLDEILTNLGEELDSIMVNHNIFLSDFRMWQMRMKCMKLEV